MEVRLSVMEFQVIAFVFPLVLISDDYITNGLKGFNHYHNDDKYHQERWYFIIDS